MHAYQRLSVPLTPTERDALIQYSQIERRDPRDQAALLVRRALEHAGYLPAHQQPAITPARNEVQR